MCNEGDEPDPKLPGRVDRTEWWLCFPRKFRQVKELRKHHRQQPKWLKTGYQIAIHFFFQKLFYLVGRWCHSACVEVNIEGGAKLTRSRADVNAVGIAVVSLWEDHSVEGSVEFNVDTHVRLFTLDLQILDLGLVTWLTNWPLIFGSRSNRTALGWVACKTAAIRWWQQSRSGRDVVGRKRDLAFVIIGSSS